MINNFIDLLLLQFYEMSYQLVQKRFLFLTIYWFFKFDPNLIELKNGFEWDCDDAVLIMSLLHYSAVLPKCDWLTPNPSFLFPPQAACCSTTVRKAPPTYSTAGRTAALCWPWVMCCRPSQSCGRRRTLLSRSTRRWCPPPPPPPPTHTHEAVPSFVSHQQLEVNEFTARIWIIPTPVLSKAACSQSPEWGDLQRGRTVEIICTFYRTFLRLQYQLFYMYYAVIKDNCKLFY